jgi:hypothetical protein
MKYVSTISRTIIFGILLGSAVYITEKILQSVSQYEVPTFLLFIVWFIILSFTYNKLTFKKQEAQDM